MTSDEIRAAVDAALADAKIPFAVRYVGETARDNGPSLNPWPCDAWRATVGKFETDYFTGLGLRAPTRFPPHHALYRPGKPLPPTAADVLHSLLLDAEASTQSFSDWCAEFGENDDSIKALTTYQACCKIGERLARELPAELRGRLRDLLAEY